MSAWLGGWGYCCVLVVGLPVSGSYDSRFPGVKLPVPFPHSDAARTYHGGPFREGVLHGFFLHLERACNPDPRNVAVMMPARGLLDEPEETQPGGLRGLYDGGGAEITQHARAGQFMVQAGVYDIIIGHERLLPAIRANVGQAEHEAGPVRLPVSPVGVVIAVVFMLSFFRGCPSPGAEFQRWNILADPGRGVNGFRKSVWRICEGFAKSIGQRPHFG